MKGSKIVEMISAEGIAYFAFDNTGTDTEQMTVDDRIARVDSALGNGTIFLPPISQVPLLQFYFIQATSTYSGSVTVKPFQGGQNTADSIFRENEGTLGGSTATSEGISAAYGWLLVMSVGTHWVVVADDLDAS
jgi:hypothetical protein